ncbi:MAG: leucyl aminopeptidase [Hyphomicrobiales bacterium]|nr:leucyl aminopeptidase [Hyphomicrobiales bacterium]
MSSKLSIDFVAVKDAGAGKPAKAAKSAGKAARKAAPASQPRTLVVFAGADVSFSAAASDLLGDSVETIRRAAASASFKGRASSVLELWAPEGVPADRLLVVGTAPKPPPASPAPTDHVSLGGYVMGKLGGRGEVVILFDLPEAPEHPAQAAADLTLGLRMRAYKFERYKTKKSEDNEPEGALDVRVAIADPAAARREAKSRDAVAEGVNIARDLVNEPPNVLYPDEFAKRAKALEKLGVEVEILDEKAMQKLGMNALLGVGQGSVHDSRMVVMRWNGAKNSKARPVAFIGKGVTFDTGGISIKPAGGMEDMKGDMAGAACVVGLMHALASRKAKVNVIGAIGLVENMPDGKAQRPGDIVTTMSGQTVEIINTDAEGRLVLADVLWRIQSVYEPEFMVNLATLTGAILVALGSDHAGLFSNDDTLSERLLQSGKDTGEKVWRMPLGPAYDKLLESKFADMKNVGGRHAGSITAAQFLQRFVNKRPWAHLDIAGTGMASPTTDINQTWGSGWGVRLLDRLVADHYES